MVRLMKRKRKTYILVGEGILINGTSEEIAKTIGYTVEHIRNLARTGKCFRIAGRDCYVNLMESDDSLKETKE